MQNLTSEDSGSKSCFCSRFFGLPLPKPASQYNVSQPGCNEVFGMESLTFWGTVLLQVRHGRSKEHEQPSFQCNVSRGEQFKEPTNRACRWAEFILKKWMTKVPTKQLLEEYTSDLQWFQPFNKWKEVRNSNIRNPKKLPAPRRGAVKHICKSKP